MFYLDPPYPHVTRASTDVYDYEMTDAKHRELLTLIKTLQGKVLLSGYPNELYDEMLAGWNTKEFTKSNNAASGKKKRAMTEVVWMNFVPDAKKEA